MSDFQRIELPMGWWMQRAEESEARGGGLSPLQAFLVAIAVLVSLSAVVFLIRPDEPLTPSPDTNTEPAFALTDTEAIKRFKELDSIRLRALEQRDPTLLPEAFTSDSLVSRNVSQSIRRLTRNKVFAVHDPYRTVSLNVLSNTADEVTLEQVVIFDVKFVESSGDEVTESGGLERQKIEWTLRRVESQWLIDDAVVAESRPIKRS